MWNGSKKKINLALKKKKKNEILLSLRDYSLFNSLDKHGVYGSGNGYVGIGSVGIGGGGCRNEKLVTSPTRRSFTACNAAESVSWIDGISAARPCSANGHEIFIIFCFLKFFPKKKNSFFTGNDNGNGFWIVGVNDSIVHFRINFTIGEDCSGRSQVQWSVLVSHCFLCLTN